MIKKVVVPLFLWFWSFAVFSQETKTFAGSIISNSDSISPIEFAHVYIKNSTIGTYTNAQGKFAFHYPDSLQSDTLVVSRVGYHNYQLPLLQLKSDTLDILLKESALNLEEVVIRDHRDSVAAIVKKVLKSFRKNYPTKTHYLEGFYRDLSIKGNTYTRLIEASIGVTENSYRKQATTTKVKIRQLRKSEDYREYSWKNKLMESSMRKMAKLAWNQEWDNNIYKLLRMNYAKVDHGKIMIWAKEYKFIEAFDFEIASVSETDSTIYYHIKFQMPPESSGAYVYFGGEITVNMEDYAIVEWKYGMVAHPYKTFPSQKSGYYQGKYYNQNHIIYTEIDNKYYPTYFQNFKPSSGGTTSITNKKTGEKNLQYDKVTFMVNRVVTKKKEFDRIKKRDALDNEVDLYDTEQPYDSAFWATYNVLLLDPLLKSAKDDLEKETALEQQFKKNGE